MNRKKIIKKLLNLGLITMVTATALTSCSDADFVKKVEEIFPTKDIETVETVNKIEQTNVKSEKPNREKFDALTTEKEKLDYLQKAYNPYIQKILDNFKESKGEAYYNYTVGNPTNFIVCFKSINLFPEVLKGQDESILVQLHVIINKNGTGEYSLYALDTENDVVGQAFGKCYQLNSYVVIDYRGELYLVGSNGLTSASVDKLNLDNPSDIVYKSLVRVTMPDGSTKYYCEQKVYDFGIPLALKTFDNSTNRDLKYIISDSEIETLYKNAAKMPNVSNSGLYNLNENLEVTDQTVIDKAIRENRVVYVDYYKDTVQGRRVLQYREKQSNITLE